MSFLYFAYGSNLWPPQMTSRCRSAVSVGTARLGGWSVVYDKPSRDGSAKLNIRPAPEKEVLGVLYRIDDGERTALDQAEHLYEPQPVEVSTAQGVRVPALTYRWTGDPAQTPPYRWYVAAAQAGARWHGLPETYYSNHLSADGSSDPMAPGIRPAGPEDLPEMQRVLSSAISERSTRYAIHPGDLAWWMYHPRSGDRSSYWVQAETGVLVIDPDSAEINAFATGAGSPLPLIEWAQRRLGGKGEIGWVSDDDDELVGWASEKGYRPAHTYRAYEWDLDKVAVPEPRIPEGWVLRSVAGEHEADPRRAASHAAFQSSMDPAAHLERYLGFMRSPVYVPARDLVAVAPDGRIGAFMIWWGDDSGIAQIEPFGTHPDHHRSGLGRALVYHGLARMRDAGMRIARVCTDDWREANVFYRGVGFADAGRLRWWAWAGETGPEGAP